MKKNKGKNVLITIGLIAAFVLILSVPDIVSTAVKKNTLYDSPQAAFAACGDGQELFKTFAMNDALLMCTQEGRFYYTISQGNEKWSYPNNIKLSDVKDFYFGSILFTRIACRGKYLYSTSYFTDVQAVPNEIFDNVNGNLSYYDYTSISVRRYYSIVDEPANNYIVTIDGVKYCFS